MSNSWFHIIVSKHIIVKEDKNKIIKINHFTAIWSIAKKTLKIIFQFLKEVDTSDVVNI